MPMGSSKKIKWCCHDNSTRISHSERGIYLHCFRCGETGWEKHGPRSIAEILAARARTDELRETRTIPKDAVSVGEGPNAAIVWLLKGGVTPEQAEKHGFKWHEATRRVLMPVPGGFLSRSVYNERPKYLMSAPGACLYWAGTTGADQEDHTGDRRSGRSYRRCSILVEDILSALAIQRAGYTGAAVLGTSLDTEMATAVARRSDLVIGWFDGDKAGDKAWTLLRKRMALHPVTLKRIRTDKDPKALPRAEVARLIQETINE